MFINNRYGYYMSDINGALTPEVIPDAVVDREQLFINNLATHANQREAAIAAGYSPTYAATSISLKFKSERFMAKLRDYYKGNAALLLPKIMATEAKVVDLVYDDPGELPKHRQTLKELKQSASVLSSDQGQVQPVLHITSIRNLFAQSNTIAPSDQEIKARVAAALEAKSRSGTGLEAKSRSGTGGV